VTVTAAEYAAIFEDLVTNLGQVAADGMAVAYAAWQSGKMTTPEFEDLVVRAVATVNGYARAGADVIGTKYVGDLTGRQLTPAGATVVNLTTEYDRLSKAAATMVKAVDTDADVAMQLDRMARNEPAEAAQRQMVHTYRGHGVKGYRRHTDSDPCELCVWLVKAHLDPEGIGYIYPANKPMHRHTGCKCTPIPAIRKETHR
jgi:hypothetical protein